MTPEHFDAWLLNPHRTPLIVGVINFTPDSFSDGGRFTSPEAAAEQAEAMVAAGADWIDVGGESTRPGASPVPEAQQIQRIAPVITAIRTSLAILISIDTTRAQVAEAAIKIGANIVNDISAGQDDSDMLALCARRQAPIVLMHMQGTPLTMQNRPTYSDVSSEVCAFLVQRRDAALAAGIQRHRILLDPGLGFGKTVSHNLQLLHDTPRLAALGQPLMVGPSRKGFIGKIIDEPRPDQRVFGTAAVIAWCAANGAAALRVHDVGPLAQVVRMTRAISRAHDGGLEK